MNEEDFDKLVYENQGIILKVCKTFFRNEDDQKDLFQDILFKLWRGKESFRNESKLSTWIYRVSFNEAIDKSRKKKPKTLSLNDPESLNLEASKKDPSNYDISALYLAIDRLKPVEKAIILLYLEEETYREISEVIGISEKNVGVKLVRLKAKLKKYYLEIIMEYG